MLLMIYCNNDSIIFMDLKSELLLNVYVPIKLLR